MRVQQQPCCKPKSWEDHLRAQYLSGESGRGSYRACNSFAQNMFVVLNSLRQLENKSPADKVRRVCDLALVHILVSVRHNMAGIFQQQCLHHSRLCPGPPSTSFSGRQDAHQDVRDHERRQHRRQRGQCLFVSAAAIAEAVTQQRASRVPPLPFVKVAGQEELKLALLLNVVDPGIGGVLVMGDRGTGKSIAVSLSGRLLPKPGPSPLMSDLCGTPSVLQQSFVGVDTCLYPGASNGGALA